MTWIVFIRHGPTVWNAEKRIQGQTDIHLSEAGIKEVQGWQLPDWVHAAKWVTSPLQRARETAALLGHSEATIVAELQEMDWGVWEGKTLSKLRNDLGGEFSANEQRGLDFQAPSGESPRDVCRRLQSWLSTLDTNTSITAITHKGVIRAALSLASNWDMKDKPPIKLNWNSAHGFRIEADNSLTCWRLNISMLEPMLD